MCSPEEEMHRILTSITGGETLEKEFFIFFIFIAWENMTLHTICNIMHVCAPITENVNWGYARDAEEGVSITRYIT